MTRSNLPGRRSAGSSISTLFVAAMMRTSPRVSKPSISARSCIRVRWTSALPDVPSLVLVLPTASISSMNTMDGDFSLARANSSRTSWAPSPIYLWTSSLPDIRMKVAFAWCATAFAISVFPVPGGPYRRIPFGGSTPTFTYISGFVRGYSTASRTSSISFESPPIWLNVTFGDSSSSMTRTRESNIDPTTFTIESALLTATLVPGLSWRNSSSLTWVRYSWLLPCWRR